MRRIQRKSGTANGDILSSVRPGRAIPYPFSSRRYYRLTGCNIHRAAFVFHPQDAFEYHRVFLEIGRLPGLDPASGTAHVRNANLCGFRVHAAYVFIDQLGFIARCSDPRGLG